MYATEPKVPSEVKESLKRTEEERQREIQNKVNVYLKYEERIRLAAYETCKTFLQISDKEVFVKKCFIKFILILLKCLLIFCTNSLFKTNFSFAIIYSIKLFKNFLLL